MLQILCTCLMSYNYQTTLLDLQIMCTLTSARVKFILHTDGFPKACISLKSCLSPQINCKYVLSKHRHKLCARPLNNDFNPDIHRLDAVLTEARGWNFLLAFVVEILSLNDSFQIDKIIEMLLSSSCRALLMLVPCAWLQCSSLSWHLS